MTGIGAGLLELHGDSIASIVMEVFPNYSWEVSNFDSSIGYLADLNVQRNLLDKIGERLGVKEFKDWYKVTTSDVKKNGGITLLSYYSNQLVEVLKSVYPQVESNL